MSVTITRRVQCNGGARGRRRIEEARPKPEVPAGRVPRISRLMALAIHMQRLIDEGVVRDYANRSLALPSVNSGVGEAKPLQDGTASAPEKSPRSELKSASVRT